MDHDTLTILAADGTTVSNPVANIAIFGLFVAITLFIVIRASKKNATTTLAVCQFYPLAQMAGAGGLVALLLNITSDIGQALVIAVVGLLMIAYVLIGGMKGTTWVQIIKAVLLIGGAAMMTVWVLRQAAAAARRRRIRARQRGAVPPADSVQLLLVGRVLWGLSAHGGHHRQCRRPRGRPGGARRTRDF